MNKSLKREIIKSAEAVKLKLKKLKDVQGENDVLLEEMFKPISTPLRQLVKPENNNVYTNKSDIGQNQILNHDDQFIKKPLKDETENDESDEENSDDIDSDMNESFNNLSDDLINSNNSNIFKSFNTIPTSSPAKSINMSPKTIPFGVKITKESISLGDKPVTFMDYTIKIGDKCYSKTNGLMELLFKNKPDLLQINENDMLNYKTMLVQTNVHRRDNDPTKAIKSNKGSKYKQIIKPLFNASITKKNIPGKVVTH